MNLQAHFEPLEYIRHPDIDKLAQSKIKSQTKTPTPKEIYNLRRILLQMPRLYGVNQSTLDNIVKQSFLYILLFIYLIYLFRITQPPGTCVDDNIRDNVLIVENGSIQARSFQGSEYGEITEAMYIYNYYY